MFTTMIHCLFSRFFGTIGGANRPGFAALNRQTKAVITSYPLVSGGPVYALAATDTTTYIGGLIQTKVYLPQIRS